MDSATKRLAAERVRRALTKRLSLSGFVRGKTSFWVRAKEHVVEFVYLHAYSFGPTFRVHGGIRVLNDNFDVAVLNGPSSQAYWSNGRHTYSLDFTQDEGSAAHCADEVARFCLEVLEPWFGNFAGLRLLHAPESPLNERERSNLDLSFRNQADPEIVKFSKELLGVA